MEPLVSLSGSVCRDCDKDKDRQVFYQPLSIQILQTHKDREENFSLFFYQALSIQTLQRQGQTQTQRREDKIVSTLIHSNIGRIDKLLSYLTAKRRIFEDKIYMCLYLFMNIM